MPIRPGRPLPAAVTLSAVLLVSGCIPSADDTEAAAPAATTQAGVAGRPTVPDARPQPVRSEAPLPGVGSAMLDDIPATSRQVLLVTGDGADENTATAVLYERTAAGWEPAAGPWPAHNALKGWTDDHRLGDLRSPIGVFGLTDAGGLLPDPGTRLPYDHSSAFSISGTGFEGEPLAGSFDYVVAIDYNRKPGTTPLDWTRPLGEDKGGGIWVHVDHDGPTQGCVSIAEGHMKELLLALDPALDPVIVMGDAAALAH
ncbi:hypothetical protein [Streptomyces sp. NPDC015242]|uniref:hypothetical protein n=1 Tax=Streptomyces sp. NPDC015242 TaxID=3364951 RepID=UPI0036FAB609